jgi:hypothetical protein
VWIFFIFQLGKIRVSPTGIVSSLCPLRCRLSSSRHCHTAVSCHTSFLLSLDDITVFTSSSGNALSRRLPSRTETEALNSYNHRRLPLLDRRTPTLHCYKKIISTLTTIPTTQPLLYFAYSLAKAPRYRSSTHHRLISIVPPHNDTHDDKLTDHLSLLEYQHVNSHEKIILKYRSITWRVIN